MTDVSFQLPEVNGVHSPDVATSTKQSANRVAAIATIQPGQITKLTVPHEDIGASITPSEEIVAGETVKIRKVTKEGWIRIHRTSELTTRLLFHKPNPDAFDEDLYFVDSALRPAVQDAMRDVRVFVYYGVRAKTLSLWVVKVNSGLSWYESLEPLFALPESDFAEHEFIIKPDKINSRYLVRKRKATCTVDWPLQSAADLLGTVLGVDHFIQSKSHPLYAELAGGEEL